MIEVGQNVLEGTWEEIAEEGKRFAGQRVRLTVLPEVEATKASLRIFPVGTLGEAMKDYIGVIHCEPPDGIPPSQDETSFGDYLEQKQREGRL